MNFVNFLGVLIKQLEKDLKIDFCSLKKNLNCFHFEKSLYILYTMWIRASVASADI